MATDEELRARIIEAAADLFAQYGFSGTKVNMVAKAARVSSQTVRRLTGGRADLFEQVMMARVSSSVAEKFATAVENPEGRPAIAVMLAAAQEVFTSPEASWGLLELEALTRAHTDDTLHEIEKGRIDRRRENAAALVARIRANGGLDADLSDTAIVHLVLAMSVGLAMLDPVLDVKPTMANWIMLDCADRHRHGAPGHVAQPRVRRRPTVAFAGGRSRPTGRCRTFGACPGFTARLYRGHAGGGRVGRVSDDRRGIDRP